LFRGTNFAFVLDDIADALPNMVSTCDRCFTEILFSLFVVGYFMIIDEYLLIPARFFHDDGFVV
jgi:hypothetical protein